MVHHSQPCLPNISQNQPTSTPTSDNRRTNKQTNERTNKPTNQRRNQRTNQPLPQAARSLFRIFLRNQNTRSWNTTWDVYELDIQNTGFLGPLCVGWSTVNNLGSSSYSSLFARYLGRAAIGLVFGVWGRSNGWRCICWPNLKTDYPGLLRFVWVKVGVHFGERLQLRNLHHWLPPTARRTCRSVLAALEKTRPLRCTVHKQLWTSFAKTFQRYSLSFFSQSMKYDFLSLLKGNWWRKYQTPPFFKLGNNQGVPRRSASLGNGQNLPLFVDLESTMLTFDSPLRGVDTSEQSSKEMNFDVLPMYFQHFQLDIGGFNASPGKIRGWTRSDCSENDRKLRPSQVV